MRAIIAANTLNQLVGKIIGAGTTFAISIILAKHFGVAGYGDVVKVTTYVAFFYLLADFGLNAIYLQQHKTVHAFPTLLGARLVGGVLLPLLSLAILTFLPRGVSQGYTDIVRLGIVFFAPSIFFQALVTTANAVFQKHLRYELSTLAIFLGSVAALALLFILQNAFQNAAITGSLVLLGGSVVTAIAALVGARNLEGNLMVSFSFARITPLFVAALPLGVTLLFNLLYGHIDSVILTLTRDTREVGIYGLAYKVFELVLVFPTFFMNAVYPHLLQAGSKKFISILKKSFLVLLLISFFLSLITWILAPLLTHIQEGFAASVPALRVLSLSLPFFFVSALTMWTLIALKKQLALVGIYGSTMLMNMLLNAWFIPTGGYMAAAWITVFSEGVVLCLSSVVLTRALSHNT